MHLSIDKQSLRKFFQLEHTQLLSILNHLNFDPLICSKINCECISQNQQYNYKCDILEWILQEQLDSRFISQLNNSLMKRLIILIIMIDNIKGNAKSQIVYDVCFIWANTENSFIIFVEKFDLFMLFQKVIKKAVESSIKINAKFVQIIIYELLKSENIIKSLLAISMMLTLFSLVDQVSCSKFAMSLSKHSNKHLVNMCILLNHPKQLTSYRFQAQLFRLLSNRDYMLICAFFNQQGIKPKPLEFKLHKMEKNYFLKQAKNIFAEISDRFNSDPLTLQTCVVLNYQQLEQCQLSFFKKQLAKLTPVTVSLLLPYFSHRDIMQLIHQIKNQEIVSILLKAGSIASIISQHQAMLTTKFQQLFGANDPLLVHNGFVSFQVFAQSQYVEVLDSYLGKFVKVFTQYITGQQKYTVGLENDKMKVTIQKSLSKYFIKPQCQIDKILENLRQKYNLMNQSQKRQLTQKINKTLLQY